jgi:tetratricopeptide (TPR) repeat protein
MPVGISQFLDTIFGEYLSFGRRWILRIPIVYTVLVLAVLVSAQFELMKKAFPSLPGSQAIITDPYFWVLFVAIWLICPVAFWIVTRWPPPKDRFVVVVANPYSPSGSERAKGEAANLQDLIFNEVVKRMPAYDINGKTILRPDTIDPRPKDGKKRARILGEHYQAHMVIYGNVRLIHERGYYFDPYVENLAVHKYRFSPSNDIKPLDIAEPERLSNLLEQKVGEVTNLATFICAMAKINEFEYEKAEEILRRIDKPFAEVHFYRGLAFLELGEELLMQSLVDLRQRPEDAEQARSYFERARSQFREACIKKQNFAHAWLYAGVVSLRLGRYEQAKDYLERASEEAENASTEGASEDMYLLPRATLSNIITILDVINAVQNRLSQAVDDSRRVLDSHKLFLEQSARMLEQSDRIREELAAGEYERAKQHLEEGAYEKAIEDFHHTAGLNSWWDSQADFHYNLARAYAHLEDRTNSLSQLSTAIDQESTYKRCASNESAFEQFRHDEEFMELLADHEGTDHWDEDLDWGADGNGNQSR